LTLVSACQIVSVTPLESGMYSHRCKGGKQFERRGDRLVRACDCELAGPPTPQHLHPELCQHRGAELRLQVCETCSGPTRIKVFFCKVHTECTIGKKLPGLACCAAGCCKDWEPAPTS
jgi:hypothetical protein